MKTARMNASTINARAAMANCNNITVGHGAASSD